jgi:hypothetical protein
LALTTTLLLIFAANLFLIIIGRFFGLVEQGEKLVYDFGSGGLIGVHVVGG